jgi:hypothetical protein
LPTSSPYPDLVSQLYRSAPDQFVAERKRLAAELKASGDKENAKRLEKLPRPSLSAWAVNQLWWQARSDFDELFASAARLRTGDLGATRSLRDARERLRVRAGELLHAGSHAVTDTVLRRVGNTLASLAASGSFDPDLPGALAADRDAPGFEATGLSDMLAAAAAAPPLAAAPAPAPPQPKPKQADLEAEHARQEALRREEQRREEQRRAAALVARRELEAELQRARAAVETHLRAVERTRVALAAEEQALERARKAAGELEAKLAALES